MTFTQVWRAVSLGVLLLSLALLIQFAPFWQWVFVVMAAMSALNAAAKRRWRFLPHPVLWALGLSWAYLSPEEGDPGHVGGWTMFLGLCGASIVLRFLVSLVPDPPEPPPPARRPGAGVVLDAEVTETRDG